MTGDTIFSTSVLRGQPIKINWNNPNVIIMMVKDLSINTIWIKEGYLSREITLQSYYGQIISYEWYSDENIIVGCSEG